MLKPATFLSLIALLITFTCFQTSGISIQSVVLSKNGEGSKPDPNKDIIQLKNKAKEVAKFVNDKDFNSEIAFLIDMSMHSGDNRFFVYNLKNDSVLKSGLVTHGRCNQDWLEGRKYGNIPGCGCSSLGKYKIGYKYFGRFGLAFKLYGLDRTNDKAFERFVVLHSHECVPAAKVDEEICQSDGCPTVSPRFLQFLAPIINNSKKPVLLWIYE